MTNTFHLEQLSAKLQSLSDEELVAVIQDALARRPAGNDGHLFLGIASEDGDWQVEALAKPEVEHYAPSRPSEVFVGPTGFGQEGTCTCGFKVRSNMKHGVCSICGNPVSMT